MNLISCTYCISFCPSATLLLCFCSFDATRSRSEQFLSPLHIPDEEDNIIIRAVDDPLLSPTPESPIPTMSTILGLESKPINDALTPA